MRTKNKVFPKIRKEKRINTNRITKTNNKYKRILKMINKLKLLKMRKKKCHRTMDR
jgi:hypothetical protein